MMATEQSSPPPAEADIYNFIHTYDFSSDLEFRKGLGIILGHPEPASDADVASNNDVVLQAKCFYISRHYKNWLSEHGLNITTETPPESSKTENPNAAVGTSSTQPTSAPSQEVKKDSKDAEPAYPSSFAHIVELITSNQPIPGIEEIPDTILAGQDEPSKATKRRKPWEKNVEAEVVSSENQA
ncbi:uncharacterized protein BHQ10_003130 [Talaromyces amestolkiae]|uniref:Uncharacterized protein n=1 Tax=Talaromyces amestolkiae TaxID=1196081 RepID=A0A364KU87_TALAM|nr:uncharacterized protein BHQ10_003130 [Talaromyces amestolkiae]RAO67118.1 hypothetical protein BHQ10_003130 [Talaromyces amestolkiae]